MDTLFYIPLRTKHSEIGSIYCYYHHDWPPAGCTDSHVIGLHHKICISVNHPTGLPGMSTYVQLIHIILIPSTYVEIYLTSGPSCTRGTTSLAHNLTNLNLEYLLIHLVTYISKLHHEYCFLKLSTFTTTSTRYIFPLSVIGQRLTTQN